MNPIVGITGHGLVTPAGINIDSLWNACIENKILMKDGLGYVPSEYLVEISNYIQNSKLVKTPKITSKTLNLALYSIIKAMEEAKWSELKDDDIILLGTTTGMLKVWEDQLLKMSNDEGVDYDKIKYQSLSALEEELRIALDFNGKVISFTSACSASTQAYINAYNLLSSGRAKRCIAGGVEELGILTIKGFSSLKILSTENCRPFNENRKGINLAEGAAFNCLEIVDNKFKGARLLAGSTILDLYHVTSPHPEGKGYQESLEETLELNNVSKEEIDLIHSHGTGSDHNDSSEAIAINNLFGDQTPVISTKGVHGHTLAASGAIEINLSTKMLIEEIILPSSMLVKQDSNLCINVKNSSQRIKIGKIIKSTLGFGGINSTILLEIKR